MKKDGLYHGVPHKIPFTVDHRVLVILPHAKNMISLHQNRAPLIGNSDPRQYFKMIKSCYWMVVHAYLELPRWQSDKSACNTGDMGLIPVSERSPGEGYGNPLQYSCLGNPKDGRAWWAIVHGVAVGH